jgi:hypothetical protein
VEGDLFRRDKISLEEAFEIANSDPRITHFVYVHHGNIPWKTRDKLGNLVPIAGIELYHEGEAAFFAGWDFNLSSCEPDGADVSVYFRA